MTDYDPASASGEPEGGRRSEIQFNSQAKPYKKLVELWETKPDAMVIAVRGQLLIEDLVNALLSQALSNIDQLDVKGMVYATKIKFLGGLGIVAPPIVNSLLALNNLRNDFAHDPYFQLSSKRMRKILATMANEVRLLLSRPDVPNAELHHVLIDVIHCSYVAVAFMATGFRDRRIWTQKAFEAITTLCTAHMNNPQSKSADEIDQFVAQHRASRFARGDF